MRTLQTQKRPKIPKYNSWDGNTQNLSIIGHGVSSLVFKIDEKKVAKVSLGTPGSIEELAIERRVYRILGKRIGKSHSSHVLTCLETENPHGLIFERCQTTIRNELRTQSPLPKETVIQWARQAAKGLAVVHDCGIVQGDVGCHNMLLDTNHSVKIGDFAGSSIDGSEATVNYEVRSRLPDVRIPTRKSDVFALGSAIYEIATGKPPYQREPYRSVQNLFRKGTFPADVGKIPDVGSVIRKCWRQGYESCWEVVDELERIAGLKPGAKQVHESPLVVNEPAASVYTTPDPAPSREEVPKAVARRERAASTTTYVHSSHHYQRSKSRRDADVERVSSGKGNRRRTSQTSDSRWVKFICGIAPPNRVREVSYYHC